MSLSIVLSGGGTAGHVIPLLATAAAIKRSNPDTQIRIIGTQEGLETSLVPLAGFDISYIPKVPFPRSVNVDVFRFPHKFFHSVNAAKNILLETKADVLAGFGGFVSTPAYIAAHRLGVPIVLHEQNASAGLANKLGATWADRILTTYPNTALSWRSKHELIGLPMRESIVEFARNFPERRPELRKIAAENFGFNPNEKTLLIMGGSLGALAINDNAVEAAEVLTKKVQVIHIAGDGKTDSVLATLEGRDDILRKYIVLNYSDQMEFIYSLADFVVARAGAGTVSELTALGLPAAYIPLSVGNGEQRKNVAESVSVGSAITIDQKSLTPAFFEETVLNIMMDDKRLEKMHEAAAQISRIDASDKIANIVLEVARGGAGGAAGGGAGGADASGGSASGANGGGSASAGSGAAASANDLPKELGKVHFIGIGGAGMSVIAKAMSELGVSVQGSDKSHSDFTKLLELDGIEVFYSQKARNVKNADTIVYSTAIKENNPELKHALELDKRILHRSEALQLLAKDKNTIAVSGSHGKSTTSAMLVAIFENAALEGNGAEDSTVLPSFAVGSSIRKKTGEMRSGGYFNKDSDIFIIEADESDKSFLNYTPKTAVITNCEPDHLDNYKDATDFESTFFEFANKASDYVVINADDPACKRLIAMHSDADVGKKESELDGAHKGEFDGAHKSGSSGINVHASANAPKWVTVGIGDATSDATSAAVGVSGDGDGGADSNAATGTRTKTPDVLISNIKPHDISTIEFDISSSELGIAETVHLKSPGIYNAYNAACAVAAACLHGLSPHEAVKGVETFIGAKRRFEIIGEANGITLIDDYAHHPTEIEALLNLVISSKPKGKIRTLFQPHLYSRTKTFAKEFANALSLADEVIVTGVYAAREPYDKTINANTIAKHINKKEASVFAIEDLEKACEKLAQDGKKGDILLLVGAGDIGTMGDFTLKALGGEGTA
jgi:UDP-N-acetylmuramate--alanine ligase